MKNVATIAMLLILLAMGAFVAWAALDPYREASICLHCDAVRLDTTYGFFLHTSEIELLPAGRPPSPIYAALGWDANHAHAWGMEHGSGAGVRCALGRFSLHRAALRRCADALIAAVREGKLSLEQARSLVESPYLAQFSVPEASAPASEWTAAWKRFKEEWRW